MTATASHAQDKAFKLDAPDALVESGLLKHILPRFSLKTGVRITSGPGEAVFGEEGVPVFRRGDVIWHFAAPASADTDRFLEWLRSDVGKRTIEGFKPGSGAGFTADVSVKQVVAELSFDGNAVEGEKLALSQCGRCHVVSEKNRMNAIGSTPSFALMRTFPDWSERFEGFYVLKPHPAFTQIEDVTPPFAPERPSPIVPIEITLDDLEAILAFVAMIPPADLGAPIQSQ